MNRIVSSYYRTELDIVFKAWNVIDESDKPHILAELYESMTDAQKDRFLAETENS